MVKNPPGVTVLILGLGRFHMLQHNRAYMLQVERSPQPHPQMEKAFMLQ